MSFSDHTLQYPAFPELFDWTTHYPSPEHAGKNVEMADVGCGFGGLLTALAPLFPDTLILGEPGSSFQHYGDLTNDGRLGMEIRAQVC